MKDNQSHTIRLTDPLPCGAWTAATADHVCGAPAFVAVCTPDPIHTGQFTALAICQAHATAAAAVYRSNVPQDELAAAYTPPAPAAPAFEQPTDVVQVWQHRTAGERYAVLLTDRMVTGAVGPLTAAEYAGLVEIPFYTFGRWDAELADDIADHEDDYRIVWPAADISA